jgi:hypothetical protein
MPAAAAPPVPPGQYLASDGKYYPVADLPTPNAPNLGAAGPVQPGLTGGQFAPAMPPGQWIEPPKKKRKAAVVGVAAGLAAVLAVGGVWAVVALSKKGGASSPEDAAQAVFTSLAAKDFDKLTATIAPSERNLAVVAMDVANGLQDSTDLAEEWSATTDKLWQSLSIEFTDLEFSTDDLAEGVVAATVEKGSVTIDANIEEMADAVADLYDYGQSAGAYAYGMGDVSKSDIEDELDALFPISKDIDDLAKAAGLDELYIVTVQEGGDWYASVSMTIAQYAFDSLGGDRSDLGDPIPENEMMGADKPEDAMANFVKAYEAAADSGDLRELAKALPVAESRLLAVYGPVIDELGGSLTEDAISFGDVSLSENSVIGGHSRLTIDLLELDLMGDDFEIAREGDTWTIIIDYAELTISQEDDGATWRLEVEEDGEAVGEAELSIPQKGTLEGSFTSNDGGDGWFEFDGECIEVGWTEFYTGQEETEKTCGDDLGLTNLSSLPLAEWTKLPDLKGILALSAVQGAGGKWYISPTASLMDLVSVVGS